MPTENDTSIKDIFSKAEEAEKKDDTKKAIELYKAVTDEDNLNIPAYDKLMKLFRKSKEYKKELSLVNKAIKVYEAYYKMRWRKHSKTIDSISSKLNKSLGLTDKEGIHVYDPEPLGKWKKRKIIVQNKLKK
ncbi:MAG TPA: hypothetical protein VGP55_06510 [Chitinophagaceae bacterium]|nr:hypothetical protein [Chitinophagaceae bacterium]